MDNPLTFGQWLKRRRRGLGLTQRTLGQQAGYSGETVRKVEADELRPSRQMAERLAEVLQIELTEREYFIRFARSELDASDAPLPTQTVELPAATPGRPAPAPAKPQHRPRRLPAALTPFIGREQELADLAHLLNNREGRLVTLVGPGGIGKTRLALQAAEQAVDFADGAYFVSLASVTSPDLLVSTMASALGFTFLAAADPRQQLIEHLREKDLLLVLDNFEHLAEEGPYLSDLLRQAPGVALLVTSREPLKLQAEHRFAVDGLDVPAEGASSAEIVNSSAVQLFLSTARRTGASVALAAGELSWMARICRTVEGMPLAIELAAAWLESLSPPEIAREIERNLDILQTDLRDVPARQRSLRATFDVSWARLSDAERQAFRRLAVFRGGFLAKAAEPVAGTELPHLASLADKSFIRRDAAGRYHIHELLRQFGVEKLRADSAEDKQVRNAHAAYYLAFLQQQERRLEGHDQPAARAEVQAEFDNIWVGWRWAVTHGQAQAAAGATRSLFAFFDIEGWSAQAEALYAWACRELSGQPHGREEAIAFGQILGQWGWFCHRLGRYGQARQLLDESIDRLQEQNARPKMSFAFHALGCVAWLTGDYARADQCLQEALAIFRDNQDHWGEALELGTLGLVANSIGDHVRAQQLMVQALQIQREVGDPRLTSLGLGFLGAFLCAMGECSQARQYLVEGLAISRRIGFHWGTATCLYHLGQVCFSVGEYAESQALHRDSRDLFREVGDRARMAAAVCGLASVHAALGERAAAEKHFAEALLLSRQAKALPVVLDTLVGLAVLWGCGSEAQRARAAGLAAVVSAHPASTQAARVQADQLLSRLRTELPPEALASSMAWATGRVLDQVVEDSLAALPGPTS